MTEFLAISAAESPRFPFLNSARIHLNPNFHAPFSPKLPKTKNTYSNILSVALSSRSNGSSDMARPSRGYTFYNELEFGLERNPFDEDSPGETESVPFVGDDDDKGNGKRECDLGEDDLVRLQGDVDEDGLKKDEEQVERFGGKVRVRKGKQVMRRSSLLAKQVISIRSALSLGFVSQLWVDTTSWMVLFVEVRPNLLSGDSEKFLLEDISQVGDVVLVQDESVIDNEFKMIGLETLVGYKVVTPSRRNIGKVRGYIFSINSGAVEELELDSFGLSIIPSSLRAQDHMVNFANRKRQDSTIKPGDWVYLKIRPHHQGSMPTRFHPKLSARYYGPCMVLKQVGAVAFKLQLPDRACIPPIFHVSQLKLAIRNHRAEPEISAELGE